MKHGYSSIRCMQYIYDLISTKLNIILIKTTIFLILDMFRIYIMHHQKNKYIISIQSLNTKNYQTFIITFCGTLENR